MTDHIRIEDADGVRTITFARPDKKNALTHAMYAALAETFEDARANPSVQVMLLTGEGTSFTAGNDLEDFLAPPPGENGAERPVEAFLRAMFTADKPVVAAVNGVAVGVGVTMLLHCDLVYASDTAVLRTPFVDLGLVPENGSSLLLPQRIGRARAAEMFLLGEAVDAAEAERLGLVARVFPADRLLSEARARAVALAAKSPTSVRETKRLLAGDRDVVAARLAEEGELFSRLLASDEFKEAATAFFEKRAPDFSRFI